jgi:hypothetical protein
VQLEELKVAALHSNNCEAWETFALPYTSTFTHKNLGHKKFLSFVHYGVSSQKEGGKWGVAPHPDLLKRYHYGHMFKTIISGLKQFEKRYRKALGCKRIEKCPDIHRTDETSIKTPPKSLDPKG